AFVSPAPAAASERPGYEAALAARNSTPELQAARAALQASDLRQTDLEAYGRRLFELAVSGYFHDPAKASQLTGFRVTGRTQQAAWDSLGTSYDMRPALRTLHVPAMLLHGDDDPIPVETARATADALDAEFVLRPNAGHVPYV